VVIVKGEGAVFGVNLWHPIVTNGDGDVHFPNYFGEDLLLLLLLVHSYIVEWTSTVLPLSHIIPTISTFILTGIAPTTLTNHKQMGHLM